MTQPLNLKRDILVSNFAFEWVNLCRYVMGHVAAKLSQTRAKHVAGRCKRKSVDPQLETACFQPLNL